MTYKELAEQILEMNESQKNSNVTVFVQGIDEYFPIDTVSFSTQENDVLDENHPVLNIANGE